MAQKIIVTQNDNNIDLIFPITKDGIVESLLGAIVKLNFINKKEGIILKRECVVTDPSGAECMYTLTKDDLKVAGNYATELQVQYSNGTTLTKLNPLLLSVLPELVSE